MLSRQKRIVVILCVWPFQLSRKICRWRVNDSNSSMQFAITMADVTHTHSAAVPKKGVEWQKWGGSQLRWWVRLLHLSTHSECVIMLCVLRTLLITSRAGLKLIKRHTSYFAYFRHSFWYPRSNTIGNSQLNLAAYLFYTETGRASAPQGVNYCGHRDSCLMEISSLFTRHSCVRMGARRERALAASWDLKKMTSYAAFLQTSALAIFTLEISLKPPEKR